VKGRKRESEMETKKTLVKEIEKERKQYILSRGRWTERERERERRTTYKRRK
jgi:hypothetical protein